MYDYNVLIYDHVKYYEWWFGIFKYERKAIGTE